MSEPAAILLAAGRASRFGTDKLLAPLARHGRTMPLIAHTLANWLQVFDRVTVVVRPGSEALMLAAGQYAGIIDWVVCPRAAQGMGASLAAGVAANRAASGWLIGLADMPAVPAAAITQVREAISRGAVLAAPFCDGQRGHPAGFATAYLDELLALDGDTGARALIERDAGLLQRIATEDTGVLADIDTPADLLLFT